MITITGYSGGYSNSNYNANVGEPLDITDESGFFEEPVSIEETKDYLRLEGYVDTDESTADDLSDFDFDDPLIASCNKASRQYFEQTLCLSLIPKTLKQCVTVLSGHHLIPWGPVGEIIEFLDSDGNEVVSTSYKISGLTDKYIEYPCQKYMMISYNAGYGTSGLPELPELIKLDILRLAAYMYEHRGDDPAIQAFASQLAVKYSRNTPII